MPSDEDLGRQAEEYKSKGNEAFAQGDVQAALSWYSQGLVSCDRMVTLAVHLKATLLSNRAMCHLKVMNLPDCIADCTAALQLQEADNHQDNADSKLYAKLLYRRAKARFLQATFHQALSTSATTSASSSSFQEGDLLQQAGKDVLSILQHDPHNAEAQQLLKEIRLQHQSQQRASTPVSKAVEALRQQHQDQQVSPSPSSSSTILEPKIKTLLHLLHEDPVHASMEMGRLEATDLLLHIADTNEGQLSSKTAVLAIQCLSQAGSHPPFVRSYLVKHQAQIDALVQKFCPTHSTGGNEGATEAADLVVSLLGTMVCILWHADRDDPQQEITGTSLVDDQVVMNMCSSALLSYSQNKTVLRAVLDLLSTWTCGPERDALIRAALHGTNDPTLPAPQTQAEIRSMTPQQLAAYRQRQYETKTRDQAWAYQRSRLFGQVNPPSRWGLSAFLEAASSCQDHVVRREMAVVLGRMLAALDEEDRIKEIVQPFLSTSTPEDTRSSPGVIIEEVYNEDGDEKVDPDEEDEKWAPVTLQTKMGRALITSALLLSKKDVGAWALGVGWVDSSTELPDLINSGDSRAMCLTSEVVSAAATVESARPIVTGLISSGLMEKLIMSHDRDIRSGAASAIAKLGLSATKGKDDGEAMGLLQSACELLEDDGDQSSGKEAPSSSKLRHFSSFASSSVERAIEMLTYLVANTSIKEELAAGFHSRLDCPHSALDRLVKVADLPNAGESLSGFGLATIFQHMAVTNLQIRKEGFEGKEVTMEQYDEMQKLGKTEEEKEVMDAEKDPDTQASCNERIRKMANASVPRALVALSDGASEHTLEQIVLAMNRMAGEPSVRGLLIQQGVLSACIKIEKNEGPTETDTMKKVIRLARHCIAKTLVTTNPSLITSAQRLGCVRPLIQLIRDIKASDLEQFEALLAITNIASSGDDAQNRIASERGIAALHFAMFSDHEMVRRAATEALCNMVPHKSMMDHLAIAENIQLWLAFATDYEENYECARAASGCLAMATQDETIASTLVNIGDKFKTNVILLLESGRLEIMHRALAMVLNLVLHGGEIRTKAIEAGLVAFCLAYVDSYHDQKKSTELDFSDEERALLPITVELARKIVKTAES